MKRFFNTTGPCKPERHYMLPPEDRLVGAQLHRYVESELYWVLHAPRQTGKTTFLQSWMQKINGEGKAVACYVSVESCQGVSETDKVIPAICLAIQSYAKKFLPPEFIPSLNKEESLMMLSRMLEDWAALVAPSPLVVLFDEVDVLQDQALISFLRQLRGGFAMRGVGHFPVSVALVGMRDLRDYLIKSKDGAAVNPGSPFNIKQDSASLSNFSLHDVKSLVSQHKQEAGQSFSDEAVARIYDLTRGQPWLVNALLQKCVWQLCPEGEPVELKHIEEARELLIRERAVHLDSLAERLLDPRIKRIVELIMTGDLNPDLLQGDDFRFALDMGLVSLDNGTPSIANPLYREIIARVLSEPYQLSVPAPEFRWKNENGSLDMAALLKEFQDFWAMHADIWEEKADYTEAFPHLLLMAFLQRVVNGGGRIEREYAAGRGRMDLAVRYAHTWNIIEIKLVSRLGREKTINQGLAQIVRYRDTLDRQAPCWLVVFDRTVTGRQKSWEERLTWEEVTTETGMITIIGG